jgi:catechol 2,3-dioxygenase-like lactoylglutathione lyase family enzyme
MLTGIDHVVFRVADVEASVGWWRDRFGLAAERIEDWKAGRSPFVSIRVSDTLIIDLLPGEPDGVNVDHVAFVTDSAGFESFVANRNDDIEMGPLQLSGAQGVGLSVYIRDPSGNRIEVRTYDE